MAGDRDGLRRLAAPVALLALVTIAVVLIHNGLSKGSSSSAPPTATAPVPAARTATTPRVPTNSIATTTAPATAEYYVVQSGDTFGSIAGRYGTSVSAIESLNPGVSSTSLTVGQKIRVK